jgi:pilin isopeptide linkage protein
MEENEFSFTVTPDGFTLGDESGVYASKGTITQRAELRRKDVNNKLTELLVDYIRYGGMSYWEDSFETYAEDGEATVPCPEGKDGKAVAFDLGTYTFSKAGTYTFTISEVPGTDTDVHYDRNTWTATVVVAEGAEGLTATVTYTDANGRTDTQASFLNSTKSEEPVNPEPTPTTSVTPEPTPEPSDYLAPVNESEEPKEPEEPDAPIAQEEPTTPEEPEAPQVTDEPTVTEQPTETVQPTKTPEPTETVAPTAQPTVTPKGTTSSTSMPQTGQDWWPVLLLAAAGIILIVVGVMRNKKHRI